MAGRRQAEGRKNSCRRGGRREVEGRLEGGKMTLVEAAQSAIAGVLAVVGCLQAASAAVDESTSRLSSRRRARAPTAIDASTRGVQGGFGLPDSSQGALPCLVVSVETLVSCGCAKAPLVPVSPQSY